jgi:heme/copper-type cytochrome/quinol oxidase subunit 2
MPIKVEVVSKSKFSAWAASQRRAAQHKLTPNGKLNLATLKKSAE